MKTLGQVLQLAIQYLKDQQVENHRRMAEELLGHVLKLKRMELYMHFDQPLVEAELSLYRDLLRRKLSGEPLEYILKEIDFYHCRIQVNPSVLIPRQETEILLDHVYKILKPLDLNDKKAWDLACGSGCLGIGLKKALPMLDVTLSDISKEALSVAINNAELNDVQVHFAEGDLLAPFNSKKADFVLCNPPYITQKEYLTLDKSVKDFEPKLALVSGPSGLEFYARLAEELPRFLNPNAKVFFEIGSGQGSSVLELFSSSCWKTKKIERDWAGHERFFFLEIE